MPDAPSSDASEARWLWQEAAETAAIAHRGQTTPGTSVPYISHPARVAMIVMSMFGCDDPQIAAAALLHDVLEKTAVTSGDLLPNFGEQVVDWVELLSKNARGPKNEYWDRLTGAPWQVRLIKMADALDHLNGPAEYTRDRLKTARKALALGGSAESEISRAAKALEAAIHLTEECLACAGSGVNQPS